MLNNIDWKKIRNDIGIDIAAGLMIAVGVYNFAMSADFPVAGFSGIAIIVYHLFGIPVGLGTLLLNVPVSLFCYKFLGRRFFFKSVVTTLIYSIILDGVAPLIPVYTGDRLLAAVCMGVLCGSGHALIFMRGSSTGGQDFITVSIRKVKPHVTLGGITFVLDIIVLAAGSILVFREMEGFIYGVIVSFLMARVMDRILYGTYEGKLALIITGCGKETARQIDKFSGRGSTIVKAIGSYSGLEKDVVICACNNKQMYAIKMLVREVDPGAFTIIVESNEVLGEGFREEN